MGGACAPTGARDRERRALHGRRRLLLGAALQRPRRRAAAKARRAAPSGARRRSGGSGSSRSSIRARASCTTAARAPSRRRSSGTTARRAPRACASCDLDRAERARDSSPSSSRSEGARGDGLDEIPPPPLARGVRVLDVAGARTAGAGGGSGRRRRRHEPARRPLPPARRRCPPAGAPGLARLATGLALREQFDLGVGRSFFRDPWVAAPATTTVRDGLGPLFEAQSCAACHPDGGARPRACGGATRCRSASWCGSPGRGGDGAPRRARSRVRRPGPAPRERAGGRRRGHDRGCLDHGADPPRRRRGGRAAPSGVERRRSGARPDRPGDACSRRGARRRCAAAASSTRCPTPTSSRSPTPTIATATASRAAPSSVWDHARGGRGLGRFGWKAGQPTPAPAGRRRVPRRRRDHQRALSRAAVHRAPGRLPRRDQRCGPDHRRRDRRSDPRPGRRLRRRPRRAGTPSRRRPPRGDRPRRGGVPRFRVRQVPRAEPHDRARRASRPSPAR